MNINHAEELKWLAGIAKNIPVRNYLEIGCRNGISIQAMTLNGGLVPGANIVAVDMPGGPWGNWGTEKNLIQCGKNMIQLGYTMEIELADSQKELTVEWVRKRGPYDLVYIDADHRYEGVKKDFENYAPMAKIIALDDIAAIGTKVTQKVGKDGEPEQIMPELGVHRFWKELKDDPNYLLASYIHGEGSPQGIGIAFRRDDMRLSKEDEEILGWLSSEGDIR